MMLKGIRKKRSGGGVVDTGYAGSPMNKLQ